MKKYATLARPAPKNEIWEQEIDGQTYLCERPHYTLKKLEVELLKECFERESLMLFGKKLPLFFEGNGRWWADPEICSAKLMERCIKNPQLYIKTMAQKVQDVKEVIQILHEINQKIEEKNPAILREQFTKLVEAYFLFYSYHFITFVLFDEMALKFKNILQQFLSRGDANQYFTEFLQAEMTAEAIRRGAVQDDTAQQSRDLFYSACKPTIFYKEPKFFTEYAYDNEIIAKLYDSTPSPLIVQEFFALRLLVPLGFQINEEAQYIESKMLCPIMKIILEKIRIFLVQQGLFEKEKDIRELGVEEIISKLQQSKRKQEEYHDH